MMPRALIPLFLAVVGAALAAAACGGGGDEVPVLKPSGQLTDPRTVPTATPWAQPPEVIYLEPGALTPIGARGEEGGGTAAPGQCGDTYIVQPGDYPFLIAEKCGVSVDDLLEANPGVEPTNLQVGQELVIPR